MKRILLLFFLVFSITLVNAQFKTYNKTYDVKNYTHVEGDPYQPALAGILAVIPGVGHFYTNQPLRGLGFIGGMSGSIILTGVGFAFAWDENNIGAPLMIIGGLSFFGFYIWNFIDAVYVAKIKNMAFRDHKISFHVEPFVNNLNNQLHSNTTGLSLVMHF